KPRPCAMFITDPNGRMPSTVFDPISAAAAGAIVPSPPATMHASWPCRVARRARSADELSGVVSTRSRSNPASRSTAVPRSRSPSCAVRLPAAGLTMRSAFMWLSRCNRVAGIRVPHPYTGALLMTAFRSDRPYGSFPGPGRPVPMPEAPPAPPRPRLRARIWRRVAGPLAVAGMLALSWYLVDNVRLGTERVIQSIEEQPTPAPTPPLAAAVYQAVAPSVVQVTAMGAGA